MLIISISLVVYRFRRDLLMGFTQGFHSFSSYQGNRKVKCSFLNFNVVFAIAFTSLTSRYEDYW